ncbi:hypothetical protein JTE90_011921 [Oedothorax gibbosus]|uniref:Uncharacterized protein n=1 Tax=Oedothorax gibbosus TaxID=931172 RepID=A0AAV6V2G3_9ARAC|nr:hypothetical protein JTE90_011921 [Oedothorax gibbosus]
MCDCNGDTELYNKALNGVSCAEAGLLLSAMRIELESCSNCSAEIRSQSYADEAEAIINLLVHKCKKTILHIKEKDAKKNCACNSFSNIVEDFTEEDLTYLYAKYQKQALAIPRNQDHMTHLIQILNNEISTKKSLRAKALDICESKTRDLIQWLEGYAIALPQTSPTQDDFSENDVHVLELVIMLYEWGRKLIVHLQSFMMTTNESEAVFSFGRLFDFLRDILAILPRMNDQISKRLEQEPKNGFKGILNL